MLRVEKMKLPLLHQRVAATSSLPTDWWRQGSKPKRITKVHIKVRHEGCWEGRDSCFDVLLFFSSVYFFPFLCTIGKVHILYFVQ